MHLTLLLLLVFKLVVVFIVNVVIIMEAVFDFGSSSFKKKIKLPPKKMFYLPTSLNEDNPKMKMASTMKMTSTLKLGTCNKVRCIIYYLKKLLMTLHLDRHSTTDPKPEMISAVWTGKRIQHNERKICGIEHAHMFRKDDFLENEDLNIMDWGKGDYGT